MQNNSSRKRKAPSRYGNRATNEISESSSETDELFGDNSMDDPNFEVSKSKRQRTAESLSSNDENSSSEGENFDNEFDQIRQSRLIQNRSSSAESDCSGAERGPTDSNKAIDLEKVISNGESCELDDLSLRRVLQIVHGNSISILTRLAVIEDSLLKSGDLAPVKAEETKKRAFEMYHNFSNSNRLPTKNLTEFNEFEKSLQEKEFQQKAVNY